MENTKKTNELAIGTVLFRIFSGIIFGFANVIPGVSGGTMMVVLGMYERIIGIITDLRHKLKTEWKFYVPVGIGMVIAIILFGTIMSKLLEAHEPVMQMFFIGVIIFSIPGIFKLAAFEKKGKKRNAGKEIVCVVCFVLMLALMVFMAFSDANEEKAAIKAAEGVEETIALDHSAGHLLMLVIYGAIACATMIIPGISGSLVMVMLGQYKAIMAAIAAMDILYLLPFAIGCLLGLIFIAKLIKYLLKNHERATYSAILGFVLGSILPIFPGWGTALSVSGIIAFVIGGACIVACNLLAPKEDK